MSPGRFPKKLYNTYEKTTYIPEFTFSKTEAIAQWLDTVL